MRCADERRISSIFKRTIFWSENKISQYIHAMICDLIDSIELKVLSFCKTLSSFKLVNQQTNHLIIVRLSLGQVIFYVFVIFSINPKKLQSFLLYACKKLHRSIFVLRNIWFCNFWFLILHVYRALSLLGSYICYML